MAEWETIEERKISGKGVLRVPQNTVKNRAFVLFATVIREPKNKYANFNYNPPKSRYASMTFLRQGYVIDVLAMEYALQVWDGVNDISGQTLIAVKCAYAGILQTFTNLATAMSATPGGIGLFVASIEDTIKDYESLRLAWDEIRIQCYADTAISLRLDALKYDVCEPEKDKDRPPPPPPALMPPVPPGQPIIDISEPYEPGDEPQMGDDNNTQPFPIDIVPPPPPPPDGLTVFLTIVYSQSGGPPITSSQYVTTPYYVWHNSGQIEGFYTLIPGQTYGYPFNIITGQPGLNPPTARLISATDDSGYLVDVRVKPE